MRIEGDHEQMGTTRPLGFVGWLALLWGGLGTIGCRPDCEDAEADARALIAEMAACNPGDTCVAANLYDLAGENNCTVAFQCFAPIRQGVDVEAFKPRARAIADRKKSCGSCAIAGCVDPSQLQPTCNPQTRRCEANPG
jgi:hypothetical protein